MRAVVVRDYGTLEVTEVDLPEPGPGQVRVKVEAAGVNPVDLSTSAGILVQAGLTVARPVTGIGWDVAGTVDAVGPDVTDVETGQRVIGMLDRLDLPLGGYAEYVVLDRTSVASVPADRTSAEWATLPLNGSTAIQALDKLGLAAGDSVLVTGAAGGLGGLVVELAVQRGLRVVALAGADDEDLVRGFGAEVFVPRTDQVGVAVRALVPGGVDGAVDAANLGPVALDAVRNGGRFVAVVDVYAPPPTRDTTVSTVFVGAHAAQLRELVSLAEQGKVTLRVAEELPLEQAALAHERFAKGGLRGRLVLIP